MTANLVTFLRARQAEDIERARMLGNTLIVHGAEHLGVALPAAERQARATQHRAEVQSLLLEETVAPYLGTAGPTGRIAEQQLRLLAWAHSDHRDYLAEWAPAVS